MVRVSLAGNAFLDRDFVLNCAAQWAEGYCMQVTDAASAESLAVTVFPPPRPLPAPGVRDIRFLVDCSGSMNGDSIAQARRALVELLVSLRDDEWINVTAFGSSTRTLFDKPQPATPSTKRHALEFAERLQADLGGTEMAAALREIALAAPAGGAAIVLITDGEVHDIADVAVRLEERKLRVFGIGVGAAPAEDVVRTLAETTGGDHCFVTPNDDMSAAVLRHLAALRALRMVSSRVDWASPAPRWQWPAGNGPRSGADPIIDAAAFTTAQERQPRLRCRFVDETTTTHQAQALAVTPAWCADNALPRLIAGLRVRELPEAAAIALAVRHQVICAHTSAIMVRQRAEDEKGDAVPELRVVPHMLAAGWGGAGTMMRSAHLPAHPAMFESSAPADYTSLASAPPAFLMAGPRMACASADPALTALPHILIQFLRSTARYCKAGQAPVPEQWDDLDSMLPTDLIPLLAWLQRAGGYPADDMRSPLILLYQALLRMPDARTRLLEAFEPMQRLVAGAAAPDGDVVAALLEFLATGRRPKTERQTL
jgi:Ca-activated chloride channel family protein